MQLSKVRLKVHGIACAIVAATLLAGCGGSGVASSTAGGGGSMVGTGGGGSSAPATITGIATPKSVSVVTAN
jgi:hypothetical protein